MNGNAASGATTANVNQFGKRNRTAVHPQPPRSLPQLLLPDVLKQQGELPISNSIYVGTDQTLWTDPSPPISRNEKVEVTNPTSPRAIYTFYPLRLISRLSLLWDNEQLNSTQPFFVISINGLLTTISFRVYFDATLHIVVVTFFPN